MTIQPFWQLYDDFFNIGFSHFLHRIYHLAILMGYWQCISKYDYMIFRHE